MKYLYLLLLPILLFFHSCKDFEGSTVSLQNDPLEVHGDSVRIRAKTQITENARVKSESRYHLQPKVGEQPVGTVQVFDEEIAEQVKDNGLDTTVEVSAPYSPEMQGKQLSIEHYYTEDGDVDKVKETTAIGECCITSSQLIRDDFRYMHTVTEPEDTVPLKLVTQVNFPIDIWNLDTSSFSDTDLIAIKDFLKAGKEGTEVRIRGNASPDGALERNQYLAEKRAEVVSEWIQNELRGAGRENYLEMISTFSLDKNSEDWLGFLRLLDEADLDQETKEIIKEIVQDQSMTPVEKEQQIADLAGGSIYELEKILSPLRRTTMVIEGARRSKTTEEMDSLATAYSQDTSGLVPEVVFSREEWLDVAARVPSGEGKRSMLMAFYEKYPDDYRMYNDLGILSLTEETDCPDGQDCPPGVAQLSEMDFPEEGDFEYEYETPERELEIEREDDEFEYERELFDEEVEIENEPDKFKYKKKSSDMKIKAEADREEDLYTYERESDDEEVEIEQQENTMHIRPKGIDIPEGDLEEIPEGLRKDYVTAKTLFKLADSMALGSVQMNCKTRCIHAEKSQIEKAKDFFTKSLAERETQEAHYNLGLLEARTGNYREALYHLERAENIPGVEYNLALVRMMTGDYKTAREEITEYIRKNPRDEYGHYALAIIGARMDDPGCVYVSLNRAIELNPEISEHAKNNLEFRDFQDDNTFARALEGEVQF